MENIPIDIHVPKLLEWLISRRISNKDWQDKILAIREKINNALQDMPERADVTELLSGTYINYFHCCRIVEILKETEADTKNLFGWYSSQRIKDWLEIIRLYQKDNVYLAEAANLLLRTVKYEVPSLRKEIAKSKQNKLEYDKKSVEYDKSVQSGKRELETICKQLKISGENVRSELLKSVLFLDSVYLNVICDIKLLDEALQYYIKFAHQINEVHIELPMISFLIEDYSRNACQYRERLQNIDDIYIEEKKESSDINRNITNDKNQDQTSNDIDWGESEHNEIEAIDWGIEIEDNRRGITVDETGVLEDNKGTQHETVAKFDESYTILDNPKTRELTITELSELCSFFTIRLSENTDEIILSTLSETQVSLKKMFNNVQSVFQRLVEPTVEQLHFIKHSPRYIDKVVASFDQKTAHIEKMLAQKLTVEMQAKQAEKAERELMPKLRLMMKKTRELQKQMEDDISKRYNNRPVHLIGGF